MQIKRPLLWCAGAYALGEVLALQSGGLWPVAAGLAAGILATGRGVGRIERKNGETRRAFWPLVLAVFFFMAGFWRFCQETVPSAFDQPDRRPGEEEDLEATLFGKVERIERRNADGRESFRIFLSGCRLEPEAAGEEKTETAGGGARESKAMEAGGVLLLLDGLPKGLQEGRDISVKARLSKMEEAGNPGQFDSRSYYGSQGIFYRAKGTAFLEASGRTDYLRRGLRLLRQYFSENLLKVAGEKNGGMLCAMVLGEKWEADEETVSLYTESGMGHLLAISGLHVSLVGMGAYGLIRKRLKGSYLFAAFSCTLLSFCYYLLSGEGTSAGRAFFMLTVYGAGQVLGRQYDLASAAALAALATLFRRPLLLFQSGFLLSYGSVLALGTLYPLFCKARLPRFVSPFLAGCSIQLVTLPVQASFFYRFSPYGLLLNLAALPLFTVLAFLGVAGALLGGLLPGPISVLLLPAGGILWLYELLGKWSLRLPGAILRTGRPETWQVLLYMGFMVFLFGRLKKRRRPPEQKEGRLWGRNYFSGPAGKGKKAVFYWKQTGKRLALCLIFLGMAVCLFPVRYRGMELVFLDVGQGDGCFLRTAEGITFLIDGGSSDVKKVGAYRLGPFLDFQAEEQVDVVLISHGDADHINGICELMEQGRVGTLVLPRGRENGKGLAMLKEKAGEAGIPVLFLGRGDRLRAGEAVFTCLWPEAPGGKDNRLPDENEASMVLWLSWRELDVLFTGDLEGTGEAMAVSYLKEQFSGRAADILKVAHHGSGSTSSADFLKTVAPGYGIISCGKNNRYGHPAEETLERLSDRGCRVFRTDLCGAVTVRSDGKQMEISGYKEEGDR